MKRVYTILISLLFFASCQSQTKKDKVVGGPCEGCEAIYEYGQKTLSPTDTLPNYSENQPKIKIYGTVYQKDGSTPVENVIIYIYHTNREGVYETSGSEKGWARRHGKFRGWVKTNDQGTYTFYTFRPAAYPNRRAPEHIHFTVKEPGYSEYYIDDIMFEDDPLLTQTARNRLLQRAGSGLVKPLRQGDRFLVKRDIILGHNIPDYE